MEQAIMAGLAVLVALLSALCVLLWRAKNKMRQRTARMQQVRREAYERDRINRNAMHQEIAQLDDALACAQVEQARASMLLCDEEFKRELLYRMYERAVAQLRASEYHLGAEALRTPFAMDGDPCVEVLGVWHPSLKDAHDPDRVSEELRRAVARYWGSSGHSLLPEEQRALNGVQAIIWDSLGRLLFVQFAVDQKGRVSPGDVQLIEKPSKTLLLALAIVKNLHAPVQQFLQDVHEAAAGTGSRCVALLRHEVDHVGYDVHLIWCPGSDMGHFLLESTRRC